MDIQSVPGLYLNISWVCMRWLSGCPELDMCWWPAVSSMVDKTSGILRDWRYAMQESSKLNDRIDFIIKPIAWQCLRTAVNISLGVRGFHACVCNSLRVAMIQKAKWKNEITFASFAWQKASYALVHSSMTVDGLVQVTRLKALSREANTLSKNAGMEAGLEGHKIAFIFSLKSPKPFSTLPECVGTPTSADGSIMPQLY